MYLRELSRVPPLDHEEEIACIRHIKSGDELAQQSARRLMEAHLKLVIALADPYQSEQIHILDLIEQGNAGLLQAIERLPGCLGEPFAVHAARYIDRALSDTNTRIAPVAGAACDSD